MAQAHFSIPIETLSGKISKRSNGYFFNRNGRRFYCERLENYQKNQSPKQIWRSAAFAYAQKQLKGNLSPDEMNAIKRQWTQAKGITSFGRPAVTPLGWKKAELMYHWQQEHPFEPWYEAYLSAISAEAEERTAAANVSPYQIKKQIAALTAQLNELQALLK